MSDDKPRPKRFPAWSIAIDGDELLPEDGDLELNPSLLAPSSPRFTFTIKHYGETVLAVRDAGRLDITPHELRALADDLNDAGELAKLRSIVRALTKVSDPTDVANYCRLCGNEVADFDPVAELRMHKPECPYRLARELIGGSE